MPNLRGSVVRPAFTKIRVVPYKPKSNGGKGEGTRLEKETCTCKTTGKKKEATLPATDIRKELSEELECHMKKMKDLLMKIKPLDTDNQDEMASFKARVLEQAKFQSRRRMKEYEDFQKSLYRLIDKQENAMKKIKELDEKYKILLRNQDRLIAQHDRSIAEQQGRIEHMRKLQFQQTNFRTQYEVATSQHLVEIKSLGHQWIKKTEENEKRDNKELLMFLNKI